MVPSYANALETAQADISACITDLLKILSIVDSLAVSPEVGAKIAEAIDALQALPVGNHQT